jgi:hypothetical protein
MAGSKKSKAKGKKSYGKMGATKAKGGKGYSKGKKRGY